MDTLGVLMVRVKAWCSFEVVSSVSGKFGGPCSTKVPSSAVFGGSLARNGVLGRLSSEGLVIGHFFIRVADVALLVRYQNVGVWQAQHFRCLGLILCGKLCRPQQECARNLGKTSFLAFSCIFTVHFSWCGLFFVQI